jgi:hypothetical protein
MLRDTTPRHALVLPGHNLPFVALHERATELVAHHEQRCEIITTACATRPMTAAEILPILFSRPLDPQQTGFAFGETLAHINYLRQRGKLETDAGPDETLRYHTARARNASMNARSSAPMTSQL